MVASDILELPCLLAGAGDPAVAVAALAGHRLTMRKEDDSAMRLSNGRVAAAAAVAAIAIGYRGLDYYYYYLVDSAADLELGSDYWRGAAASVYFADLQEKKRKKENQHE